MNENLLVYAQKEEKIINSINLKNHSKKKRFKLEGGCDVQSVFSLNEKQFIVSQEYKINQFELGKDNNFNLIKILDLEHANISKYTKNRFIILKNEVDDIIYLYG